MPVRPGGKAPEPNCGRAVLQDPRFLGLAALSIAISAGYSTTGSAGSVAVRIASFVVGAVCLVAFNAFLIMITLRHSTPSQEAMVRSRNALFALAAVFLALAVFGAVARGHERYCCAPKGRRCRGQRQGCLRQWRVLRRRSPRATWARWSEGPTCRINALVR